MMALLFGVAVTSTSVGLLFIVKSVSDEVVISDSSGGRSIRIATFFWWVARISSALLLVIFLFYLAGF